MRIAPTLIALLGLLAMPPICGCDDDTQRPNTAAGNLVLDIEPERTRYLQGDEILVHLTNRSRVSVHVWAICPPLLQIRDGLNWQSIQLPIPCPAVMPRTFEVEPGTMFTLHIPNPADSVLLEQSQYRAGFSVSRERMGPGEEYYSPPFLVAGP